MNSPNKRSPSARELAGKVVHDVINSEVYSNLRLSELLAQSQLESRDRNFCTELVYGTLRWALPLEDSLRSALTRPGKIPPRVMAHWLVAAYQLQHMSETIPSHAAVNETVSLVKRMAPGLAGLTNAVLRKLGSPKHQMLVFDKATALEIAKAFGIPPLLVDCIQNELPREEWAAAVASFNDKPTTYFRSHASLAESKVELVPHAFVPGAFYGARVQEISESQLVVQDPASQVAALLLAPSLGNRVLDMCAAPGMKALILKGLVGPSGSVLAVEVNPAKKARLVENATRLKLKLEIRIADARKLPENDQLAGSFDAVMLDAPCSGLGTIRRHPEIRMRHSADKIAEIVLLQRELLQSAAKLVKAGGTIVYSVCSPLFEEGRGQIEWFLSEQPDFSVEDARITLPWLPKDALTSSNHVALWPHKHDSDAFFAARLVKR